MKKIFLIYIMTFCFLQGQDFDIKFDDVIITSDDTAKVRMRALNFTDISSLQFSLKWLSEVIEFVDVQNFADAGMNKSNFNLTRTDEGELIFVWYNSEGSVTTIGNGETIFELVFVAKEIGASPIVFDNEPIIMEASQNYNVIAFGNYSGSVNVVDPSKANVIFAPTLNKVVDNHVTMPFRVSGFTDISSFQFSLFFDDRMINIVGGQGYEIDIDSTNFGEIDQGTLVSWFNQDGETSTVADNTVIFELEFEVNPDFDGQIPITAIVDFGFQSEVSQNFEVVNFVQRHDGLEFDITAASLESEFSYSSIPGLESYLTLYLYYNEMLKQTPSLYVLEGQDMFDASASEFIAEDNIYVINHLLTNFGDIDFHISSEDLVGNMATDTVTINVQQSKQGQSKIFEINDKINLKSFTNTFARNSYIYTTREKISNNHSSLNFISDAFRIKTSSRLNTSLQLTLKSSVQGELKKFNEEIEQWESVNSFIQSNTIKGEVTGEGLYAFTLGEDLSSSPQSFSLEQNYPNPFNPITEIRFNLPISGHVELDIYNIAGKRIKNLLNESLNTGIKSITWNGTNQNGFRVSSGVYFYVLKYNGQRYSKKMILMK